MRSGKAQQWQQRFEGTQLSLLLDSAGSIDVGPRTIFFIRMIGSAAADALPFVTMAIGARRRTNATPFAPGVIHALVI